MKKKSNGKAFLLYLVLIIGIILIANTITGINTNQKEIKYSEVVKMFQNQEIKRYYVDNADTLYLSTEEAKGDSEKIDVKTFEYKHVLADIEQFRSDLGDLIIAQTAEGVLVQYDYQAPTTLPWWAAYLPYLIVIIVLIVIFSMFISRTSKGGGGMGLGGLQSAGTLFQFHGLAVDDDVHGSKHPFYFHKIVSLLAPLCKGSC